jgi:hypothetical protein
MNAQLTYREKFTSEMVFGGVPCDIEWIRNSNLFQEGLKKFDSGEWKFFEKEIWKDVKGYEGKYKVSNHGRVKSLERITHKDPNGKIKGSIKRYSFMLKCTRDSFGYPKAALYKDKTTQKSIGVHRLVAEAFIPNPECKPYVNHINMVPSDNHVNNLEWVTPRENKAHGCKTKPNKSSKYTGVSWSKKESKWVVSMIYNKKNISLGRFKNEEDAAKAYNDGLIKYGVTSKYKN